MIKKVISLLLLLIPTLLLAQAPNFDNLITERYFTCADVGYNAPRIIANFYQQKEYDSLYQFLDYYEQKCYYATTPFLLRLKLQLQQRSFKTENIDSLLLKKLIIVEPQIKFSQNKKVNQNFYQTEPQILLMEDVIKQIEIKTEQKNRSTDESFLIDFLINKKVLLANLNDEKYDHSKLAKLYRYYDKVQKNALETRYAFILGTVFSQQETQYIKPKPSIGFELGLRKKNHHLSAVFSYDFANTPDSYLVLDDDSLSATEDWSQAYFGAEYGYEIFRMKSIQPMLLGGIGYNLMSNRHADTDNNIDAISKGSLNLNAGIGLEKKFDYTYLGLQLRYNFTNYKYQLGETPVYGNYLNVRLILGIRAAQNPPNDFYSPYGGFR